MVHPKELKYSATDEWVRVEGNRAMVGITDYAQHELGDVVYLDLPDVGRHLNADDLFGTVESVKAVADLISPVTGEVVEVNEALTDTPEVINQDPYGRAWMMVVKLDDPSEAQGLMTADQYEELRLKE
jgi:glycine cleavage system H protein